MDDSLKFRHQYRITSTRLKDWDYTSAGCYFITICTRSRVHWFGEIYDGNMHRSPLGEVAFRYWLEIPDHFPHASLDEFVIMPNHVHGIITINTLKIRDDVVETQYVETHLVETQHAASLRDHELNNPPKQIGQKPLPKAGSISTIVRSYKSAVTRWAGKNGYAEFRWQARFYDHIVRDEKSRENIYNYILGNPLKWAEDEYYSDQED